MRNKKFLLSFSTKEFINHQKRLILSAKLTNKFDGFFSFTPNDIEPDFYNKFGIDFWERNRGFGFWLWKPYFINKILNSLENGDYLIYSDSGVVFINNINKLIFSLKKVNQDIMPFSLPLIEKQWTKPELFISMNCQSSDYSDTNQFNASFIIIKKSNFSINFFNEFLDVSTNLNNLDPKSYSINNYFIEHRHDQSIFSLLCKKYNLTPFRDPSQFGKLPNLYKLTKKIESKNSVSRLFQPLKFTNSKYGMIILHTRKRGFLRTYISFILKYLYYFFSTNNL